MKRRIMKPITFLMLLCFCLSTSVTPVLAVENDSVNVVINDQDYFNDLLSQNNYLKNRVEELRQSNFDIDPEVKSVKGVDFVYYTNSDNSITGLVQLHEDLNSEIRINSVNSEPNTIEFIQENGNKMVLGKDQDGSFTTVLYQTEEYMTYRAVWWCPYVVGLVGTSIGSLYTHIAFLVGGPVAAVIVAGVSSVGWTYVSNQCK